MQADPDPWPETPLHPVSVGMLARARALGLRPMHTGTPEAARATYAASRVALGEGPAVAEIRHLALPTRAGSIQARLYRPAAPADGLCVYLHGGGWMLGALADYDVLARTLAARSGCIVLVPDYRLAPEHPFPAGLDDCEDALRWAAGFAAGRATAAGDLPLVLAGDSAGGNLATVAAARLAGHVALAGQALVYPVTDTDPDTASYRRYGAGLPLEREDMLWFLRHYAPEAAWQHPDIAPLRRDDLSRQPPAVLLLAEHDVLRDEGEAYARRLADAGRLVAIHRYPGIAHGALRYHNAIDTADRAVTDLAAALAGFCATA